MQNDTTAHGSLDLLADTEAVIVAYRSRPHVEELLDRFPTELSIAVVDNSGNVDDIADLAKTHPNVRLVDGGGQGFARAANLGAFSSDKGLLLFINPDSRPSVDDLRELVIGVDSDPGAAAHCASSADEHSIEIGAGGWEPSIRRTAVHALGLHKIWPHAGLFAKPRTGEVVAVDWCSGACMAVRRDVFAKLGGFDETFYVYCEDLAFGRVARTEGLRTVLREDVVIRHVSGNSGAPSLEMLRLRGASFAGYVLRYHPQPAAQAMRILMVAGAAVRSLAAFARRHQDEARHSRAFALGLITRSATVGGTEVARARFDEINHPAGASVG